MKRRSKVRCLVTRLSALRLALVGACLGVAPVTFPASPTSFRPGELWPDDRGQHINAHGGGLLFHQGLYYWFGEHKIAGKPGNTAQVGVHVYSSSDLYAWKDEGIALPVSSDPANDIARGCILERPKVLFNRKTGKFVMWFHLELKGEGYRAARSGVAVADRVAGPYHLIHSLRPNAEIWPENLPQEERRPLNAQERGQLLKQRFTGGPPDTIPFPGSLICRRDFSGGQMARDMNLFLDDDGIAYHIYSSEENGTLHVSQLGEDFLRPAGRYVRILPGAFNEAPALFKKEGRYFLLASGTTGWDPNPGRLCSALSIWGPWAYVGNPCRGSEAQTKTTFQAQPTFVLPVAGRPGQFIFMADRWRPRNAIDGRYVWLPIRFERGSPILEWKDAWSLDLFEAQAMAAQPGSAPKPQ